ncbi:Putative AC transposase, partial [Linum grandiflorum]
ILGNCVEEDEFDILSWWKLNGPKYPTLQVIAKDVLVVPITSVASESAFTSGGRLLDPHKSRLHWNTVETLMCTRSWMQDETKKDIFLVSFLCSIK